jgi:hypothetical protein
MNAKYYDFYSHVITCTNQTVYDIIGAYNVYAGKIPFHCFRKSDNYFYWAGRIMLYNSSTDNEQWCYIIPIVLVILYHKLVPVLKVW